MYRKLNIKIKYIFSVLLLISIISCNQQLDDKTHENLKEIKNLVVFSVDKNFSSLISFKNEKIIIDSTSSIIGRIGDIAVDSLGRIFIADLDAKIIHIYNSQGSNIGKLGGEGVGPDEFSYIKNLYIRNGYLYAIDSNFGIRKSVKFNLNELDKYHTTSLARNRKNYKDLKLAYFGIYKIYVLSDDTYLAEFVVQETLPTKDWQNVELNGFLYFIDQQGNIKSNSFYDFQEAIIVKKSKGLNTPIRPFFGTPFIETSSTNEIYISDPQLFLIRRFDSDGNYKGSFHYPIKKVPLTQESAMKIGIHKYFIDNMQYINDLPSHWPSIKEMRIDDEDRIWIAVMSDSKIEYDWWILDSNGEMITRFNLPKSKSIKYIRNGFLYILENKLNADFQHVIRYKFEII